MYDWLLSNPGSDLPPLDVRLKPKGAGGLTSISRVDTLQVFPLGAEAATREIAAEFRVTPGG